MTEYMAWYLIRVILFYIPKFLQVALPNGWLELFLDWKGDLNWGVVISRKDADGSFALCAR